SCPMNPDLEISVNGPTSLNASCETQIVATIIKGGAWATGHVRPARKYRWTLWKDGKMVIPAKITKDSETRWQISGYHGSGEYRYTVESLVSGLPQGSGTSD